MIKVFIVAFIVVIILTIIYTIIGTQNYRQLLHNNLKTGGRIKHVIVRNGKTKHVIAKHMNKFRKHGRRRRRHFIMKRH